MDRCIQRTLTEEIPATPDQVREFYTDLHNIKTWIRWWSWCEPPARRQPKTVSCTPIGCTIEFRWGRSPYRRATWHGYTFPGRWGLFTEARQFPGYA